MSIVLPEWKERAAIGRLVELMPQPERTVMQLYYHARQSEPDIAHTLDTTPAAVAVIRQRALHRIRETLGW